ncbi:MAG: DUF192 domain-containing protein [Candidatus Omnitrophota bacterium]|jgi:uncharacterized membrane protein (UPF0127 family)|nr:MAG: DUF192 domain-containing protein [Candidatus Omnitrophota bacterium]
MKIINTTQNTILADKAVLADNPFSRMKGLLGRKALYDGEALVLKPANSIHTFFMRFSIDVIFLGRDNKVVKIISHLKPFRLSPLYFSSSIVIELPSGYIKKTNTKESDILSIQP